MSGNINTTTAIPEGLRAAYRNLFKSATITWQDSKDGNSRFTVLKGLNETHRDIILAFFKENGLEGGVYARDSTTLITLDKRHFKDAMHLLETYGNAHLEVKDVKESMSTQHYLERAIDIINDNVKYWHIVQETGQAYLSVTGTPELAKSIEQYLASLGVESAHVALNDTQISISMDTSDYRKHLLSRLAK